MTTTSARGVAAPAGYAGRTVLVAVICLYALWGMAHNLNDILISQFKRAFELNDLQSSLVQSCFYFAYFVAPIPAMLFLQSYGYRRGIILGLLLYASGAFLFWPAAESLTYAAFLGALFIIACGIVFLETCGTGVIVGLGPPESAEWRINLAQAFNPIGAIAGILIGREFIFSEHETSATAVAALSPSAHLTYRLAEARAVQAPYLVIGLVLVAVAIYFARLRPSTAIDARDPGSPLAGLQTVLRSRLFVLGVVAQFFYVGAQIGMWSFLIRYVSHALPGVSVRDAAIYLFVSLGLFLGGRLVSLPLLRRFSSAQIGAVFAAMAVLLTAVGVVSPDVRGVWALVAASAFMSVMYPAIYATGLHEVLALNKPAAALMTMSIVGGAVLAAVMGALSDHGGIAVAYGAPLVCFLVVLAYCLYAIRRGLIGPGAMAAGH